MKLTYLINKIKVVPEQLVLKTKDSPHPENCMITAIRHADGNYCVEIYNVFGTFHSLKPLQENIKGDSKWHKYKNKRYMMSEQDLNTKYTVTRKIS